VETTATRLIYLNHAEDDTGGDETAECCFCGLEAPGVEAEEAISQKYFNDGDLIQKETGHVCRFCTYCMNTRELKTGHWLATENQYKSFSTGDIYEVLKKVAEGEYDTPLSIHVSDNPIKAQHSYLWCPVLESTDQLLLSYGKQVVRFRWSEFKQLVDDIEILRRAGFRVKDIKSGEPRVRDLEDIGAEEYRKIEDRIQEYRGSTVFELALTASTRP